jgi:hypothetical protein
LGFFASQQSVTTGAAVWQPVWLHTTTWLVMALGGAATAAGTTMALGGAPTAAGTTGGLPATQPAVSNHKE